MNTAIKPITPEREQELVAKLVDFLSSRYDAGNLYDKDATLYWGEDQECAGEIGTEAYIFQIDEENGWLINFRSFKLSPDELVSVAEQVKIS